MLRKKIFFYFNVNILMELFLYSALSSFIFYFISLSPSLLSIDQPDSDNFTNPNSTRKIFYLIFFQFCNYLEISIITAQKIIITISLSFLIFALRKSIFGRVFCILFLILVLLNIYYTSFSKTILSEPIFFGLINISAAMILLSKKTNFNLYFQIIIGIFLGLIFSIKMIGAIITICFLSYFIFEYSQNRKGISVILFSTLVIIILENILFYSNHTDRQSVFKQSAIGKVVFISGKDSLKINNFPKESHSILEVSKDKFAPVHKYINKIKNPFLKSELLADYEVVAQYQFLHNSNFDNEQIENFWENAENYLFILIKNNFFDYLKTSFFHYIGLWSAGLKFIHLDNLQKGNFDLPLKNELLNASGPINLLSYNLLILGQVYFILIFFVFTILTFSLTKFIQERKNHRIKILILFVLSAQIYLFSTAFTNVATIRYLMPVYPIIIITILMFLNDIIVPWMKKNLTSSK